MSARRGALARPREATKHGERELRSGRENMVLAEISDGEAEADDVIRPAFREPLSTPRGGRRRAMAQSELIASRA
jgi:hypothetical protein